MHITTYGLSSILTSIPVSAIAADTASSAGFQQSAQDTGVSAIWILANISYAGMRAQNSASSGWRVVSFIFGFPGTLLTFLVVPEGAERAYGIDIPKKR
jgi:heme/copper-type cytochrome/quinol oxidase subunit 4